MSITLATKMSDLVDISNDFHVHTGDPCFSLQVDADGNADVELVELLGFHAECVGDDWARAVDAQGYLLDGAAKAVVKRCAELISKKARVSVDAEYAPHLQYDDEPTLGISFRTRYEPGETFDHWFDRVGWPIVATMINVTDPGTFMSPYLFGDTKELFGNITG